MKKILIIASVIILALASTYYWLRPAPSNKAYLRIATEGAYAPFNFVAADGRLTGFDIDIGQALCERMNRQCEFTAVPWDGLIPGLLEKRYDVILASMLITEERKAIINFTNPYYRTPSRFVVHKGEVSDISSQAMADMTIGAQRGTAQARYLEGRYQDFRLYETADDALAELANKRLNAVLGEQVHIHAWLGGDAGRCCEMVGPELRDPKDFGEGTGIAVRKEDQELLGLLNAALIAIKKDGTYRRINARYFPFSIE